MTTIARLPGWTGVVVSACVGFVLLGAASSPRESAPTPSPSVWATAAELDTFVQHQRADLGLAGLAVVVVSQGTVTFEGTYGDAAPGGPAVTLDTPFALGSTSKQFTGLVIQQLIAGKQLALDDTVGNLLPGIGGATSPFAAVTVAQLLTHTSGISEAVGAEEFDVTPAVTSIREEARRVLANQPAASPGSRFEYSNANYTELGAIIEQVTGHPFEDALQKFAAEPLGLTSTTSDLALARSNGLAVGTYRWFGTVNAATPGPMWPMAAPSAFVTSTARDLTRLVEVQLGQPSDIPDATMDADRAPLASVNEYSQYGSGWYVRPFWEMHDDDADAKDPALPTLWEHDGSTERSVSYLAFAPTLGFGVVVVSNTGLGTDQTKLSRFTYSLLHTIVGTKGSPSPVDPLIAAAPVIMIGLPVLQLLAVLWCATGRRRRVLAFVVGAAVTVVSLLVTLIVVPGQTREPLLTQAWWSASPDLALSVGVTLVLSSAWLIVAGVRFVRRPRQPR